MWLIALECRGQYETHTARADLSIGVEAEDMAAAIAAAILIAEDRHGFTDTRLKATEEIP